jgi:ABC-type antimicrobial peptide transport system permease subunit
MMCDSRRAILTTSSCITRSGNCPAMVSRVRAAVREVDPDLPIGEIRPLADIVDLNLAHEKTMAMLSACFGLVAPALTCIGVYGVISYAAKRRTQEIGIRLALRADGHQVALLMMRDMMAAGPAIRSQLFGIAPHDYPVLAGSAVVPAAISAVAGYLSGRHAARLDPMEALREE